MGAKITNSSGSLAWATSGVASTAPTAAAASGETLALGATKAHWRQRRPQSATNSATCATHVELSPRPGNATSSRHHSKGVLFWWREKPRSGAEKMPFVGPNQQLRRFLLSSAHLAPAKAAWQAHGTSRPCKQKALASFRVSFSWARAWKTSAGDPPPCSQLQL